MDQDLVNARYRLRVEHGHPRAVHDRGGALRTLGARDQLHPRDAVAFVYSTRAAADAYAQANLDHYGHPSIGPVEVQDGWLSVLDLRPAFTAITESADDTVGRWQPTDPGLPDDWKPAPRRVRTERAA